MNDQERQTEAAGGQSRLTDGLGMDLEKTTDFQNLNFTIEAFHYEAVATLMEGNSEAINLAINLARSNSVNDFILARSSVCASFGISALRRIGRSAPSIAAQSRTCCVGNSMISDIDMPNV